MAALGEADSGLAARLLDYLALLQQWNRAYNLTAVREPAQMVRRHLLDSLAIARFFDAGPLADLGSGAGLPGLVLAMARPQLAVSVVESNGKKARFLREVVRRLGLCNVRVLECRAEAVPEPGAFAYITARALGTLAQLIAFGGHLLRPGGRLLAMKGQYPEAEIAALPPGWRVYASHVLDVPGEAVARHLIEVERVDPERRRTTAGNRA